MGTPDTDFFRFDELPAVLLAQLTRAAAAAGHSLEAELILRLQASFIEGDGLPLQAAAPEPARRMLQFRDKSGQIIEVPADF